MKQLFNVDGPVMTFLNWVANIMILSVLWLLCSIPVITIGASTSALYYVALKMVRGEAYGTVRPFFKALKENLRAGIVFSLLFGLAGAVLCLDYALMFRQPGVLGTVLSVVFLTLGFCYLTTMLYTFPLQAQFINTVGGTLKNAFVFSVRNFKITLIVLWIHIVPCLVVFLSLENLLKALPLLFLLVPGLVAYLSSTQFMKVFKPLMENTAQ